IVQYKSPIHVSDAATGAEMCQIAVQDYEQPAGFADGAKRLITVSIPDRTVRVREIATGAVVQQFVLPIPARGGFGRAFSADGKELLAWQNDRIYFWDVRAGREVREIDISASRDTDAAAISPDGRTVASGSFDGKIRLYD